MIDCLKHHRWMMKVHRPRLDFGRYRIRCRNCQARWEWSWPGRRWKRVRLEESARA